MPFIYFDGTGLSAQTTLITIASLPFTSPFQPLVDPLGNPITVQVVADIPSQSLSTEMAGHQGLIHVEVEEGPTHLFRGYGKAGKDPTGKYRIHTKIGLDWRARFSTYAGGDAAPVLTRWLAQWLMHAIPSAYAVDANGVRLDGYLITAMRQCGISPRISPLFDGIDYTPPAADDPRPFGQPFRARLRMHFNVESNYLTPIKTATGTVSVTPQWPAVGPDTHGAITPPAGVPLLPITIPIPARIPSA